MAKVLLIDDDPMLGRGLILNLESEGFEVRWSQSLARAGDSLQSEEFDLIVLDLNLPDGNGISFLRKIRQLGVRTPVIILTARTNEADVVEGFNAGANDYVRKPFGALELIARVRSALKQPETNEHRVRINELTIVVNKRQVFNGKDEILLNRRQFDILLYLAERPGTVVTRQSLIDFIDREGEIFDRTIDTHISHLRSRLKKSGLDSVYISSVYGVGYRLDSTQKNQEDQPS